MIEFKRGKFITVHGIDGTGKTTTTTGVVEKMKKSGMSAINYDDFKETLDNPHARNKTEIKETGTLEEKLAIYLESMMYHSDQIEELLAKGYHVVKSRYLDDIKAHFSHLGVDQGKLGELESKFPMVQPDLKVVLVVDEEERRKRIQDRGVLNERDQESKKTDSRLGFFEDYLLKAYKEAPPESVLHVDSGIFDIDEVAKKIINHIIINS